MLEKIILTNDHVKGLNEMMNDNHEYMGTFLMEITNSGMNPLDGVFCRGGELDADQMDGDEKKALLQMMNKYAALAKENPETYAIIQMHTHGRKFGELIQKYDPYWTIKCTESRQPGKIVNDKFYVSKREGGDDLAFKEMAELHIKKGIKFYHLFVHPEYKSEGTLMSEDKIKLTGYKFNPNNIGNVEEIPIEIS